MTRREMFTVPAALAGFAADVAAAAENSGGDFRIGICSYTFREFQRHMAIDLMKQLSVSTVSVKERPSAVFAHARRN